MESVLDNSIGFEEIILKFKHYFSLKDNEECISFNSGSLYELEGYKKSISKGGYESLNTTLWSDDWIGTGKILESVYKALNFNPPEQKNNLVDWRKSPKILELKDNVNKRLSIEELLFLLYKTNRDEFVFNQITHTDRLGANYDLIAYLFFLKNPKRYLPNRPTFFDKTFSYLNIDLKTSHHCSWTNYLEFLSIISEVRERLAPHFVDTVDLIDAHSFCWILADDTYGILDLEIQMPETGNSTLIFSNPPTSVEKEIIVRDEPKKFKGKKNDWGILEKRIRKIGIEGELFVLESEKKVLKDNGRADLAKLVEHVSRTLGDGIGYDIKSYTPDGKEKFIEIKTTTSGKSSNFIITENELEFSRQHPDNYYLYRLYDFNSNTEVNDCYVLQGDISKNLVLRAIQYYASPTNQKMG